jgi:hypothetical protein
MKSLPWKNGLKGSFGGRSCGIRYLGSWALGMTFRKADMCLAIIIVPTSSVQLFLVFRIRSRCVEFVEVFFQEEGNMVKREVEGRSEG